jgi:hypothetical protein
MSCDEVLTSKLDAPFARLTHSIHLVGDGVLDIPKRCNKCREQNSNHLIYFNKKEENIAFSLEGKVSALQTDEVYK